MWCTLPMSHTKEPCEAVAQHIVEGTVRQKEKKNSVNTTSIQKLNITHACHKGTREVTSTKIKIK